MGSAKSGFIMGINKCQIVDRSIMQPGRVVSAATAVCGPRPRSDAGRCCRQLKPGTLDFDLTPHQPFADLVRDANREALEAHAAAVAAAP